MANDHKNLEVERKIDQREFTRETGVTPDVWHPINVAPIKLKELKDEMASLSEIEKKKRAAEFIEKNKIPEGKSNTLPALAVGVVSATAAGTLVETAKPGTLETMKLATIGLWTRAGTFFEKQNGFMKDMWNIFRDWLTKDIPEEKPKLFEDPMGWFKYTFLGFLKLKKPKEENPSTLDQPKNEVSKMEDVKKNSEALLSAESYNITAKLLLYGSSREKFDTALGGILAGLKDATWDLTDVQKQEEVKNDAVSILQFESVKTKSWSEIEAMKEKGLLQLVGNVDTKRTAAVSLIFKMISLQSKHFDSLFAPNDWRNIPVAQLIGKLSAKDGYSGIENLKEKISNFDIKSIASSPENLFTHYGKDKNGDMKFDGVLAPQLDSLKSKGLTEAFFRKIFMDEAGKKPVSSFLLDIKNLDLSDKEKDFVSTITNKESYLNPLNNSLRKDFGYTDGLISHMDLDTLSMKDLTEIYMITGGLKDVSNMNKGQKVLLYSKLASFFTKENSGEFGEYSAKMIGEGGKKYPMVLEVGNTLDTTMNYAAYKSTFTAVEGGEAILDFLLGLGNIHTDNRSLKAVIGGGGIAGLTYLAIKLSPIGRVASIVTLLAAALGVAGVTAAQAQAKK